MDPKGIDLILKDKKLKDALCIHSEKDVQSIAPLLGGFSGAFLYKATINNKAYVVRRSSDHFGAEGLKQEFQLSKLASDLGISPKVYYTNIETGIIVTEFIEHQLPKDHDPRPLRKNKKWLKDIIKLIKKIQNMDIRELNMGNAGTYKIFDKAYTQIPKNFLDRLDKKEKQLFERIAKTPWPKGENVFAHGDFSVANLLFNGEKFYIVDWETAGYHHLLFDIAYFANFLVMTKSEGLEFLTMYLEREPTEHEMQQFNHLRRYQFGIHALHALGESAKYHKDQKTLDKNTSMTLEEMRIAFGSGKMCNKNSQDTYLYGLKLLEESGKF